nr:FAD-binding oxidoreductase [Candidatus Njordarchaeum guaymaensis]
MKEKSEAAAIDFSTNVAGDFPDSLYDESRLTGFADSISFPTTEEELRDHLAQMSSMKKPVTLQGMRTGITGGAVPNGGHVINLSRMNRILGLRRDSQQGAFFLRLQPGVLMREQIWPAMLKKEFDTAGWSEDSLKALDEFRSSGTYFFPPDPSEPTISIGGMTACDSKGARSFLYGPVRKYVERLRIVLPDGSTLDLRRGGHKALGRSFSVKTDAGRLIEGQLPTYKMPNVKNSAGYYVKDDMDLIDLFIGSEGTLGVFSEVEVRLIPMPAVMWGIMVFLPSEEAAIRFVKAIRTYGKTPACIEFLDCHSLDFMQENSKNFPHISEEWHTAVYVEYYGRDQDEVEKAVMEMSERMVQCGGRDDWTWVGSGWSDLYNFKQIRHALPELVNGKIAELKNKEPRITKLGTDLAVPDSHLDEMMSLYHKGLDKRGFNYLMFGHIGDNNIHVNIIPKNFEEYEAGWKLHLEWAKAAVKMGGTVSAEHGIGKLKPTLLKIMYREHEIRQMQQIKRCFDPENILNPENIFGEGRGR